MSHWRVTHKGDHLVRALADRHYTRQKPGAAMFTRPGYSAVLVCLCGRSGWVWWRPKWEDGRPGTKRKDGLQAIECTLFRREHDCECDLSSYLINSAVDMLGHPDVKSYLHWDNMGELDKHMPLLTAVGVKQTARGRSIKSLPGQCYRKAGWKDADPRRPPLKGKIWLYHPF